MIVICLSISIKRFLWLHPNIPWWQPFSNLSQKKFSFCHQLYEKWPQLKECQDFLFACIILFLFNNLKWRMRLLYTVIFFCSTLVHFSRRFSLLDLIKHAMTAIILSLYHICCLTGMWSLTRALWNLHLLGYPLCKRQYKGSTCTNIRNIGKIVNLCEIVILKLKILFCTVGML